MKVLRSVTTYINRCFSRTHIKSVIPFIQLYITGNKWKKDIDNYSGSFFVNFDKPYFRYSACGISYDIAKAVYYGLSEFVSVAADKYFLSTVLKA